jgi:CheY-like chemotaxis protein
MLDKEKNKREILRNLSVLVVDDVSAVRQVLAQILRGLGVEGRIDTASDGLEAWEMMQINNYGVVICDIRMPRMNGLELRKLLRATPRFADMPFLMITGEVSEDIMAMAVESKWDGYLLKPFPSAVLEKRLLKLLDKSDSV